MLLTDDRSCLEDEEEIPKEVERFYGELFKSTKDSPEVLATRRELLQYTTIQVIEE